MRDYSTDANFPLANLVEKEDATDTSPLLPEDAQDNCLLFALPIEIRTMVYECILVSGVSLYGQEHRVGGRTMIPQDRYRLVSHLESAVLRTCQTIYREALPILYHRNTFVFSDPCGIRKFEDANLPCLGKSIPGMFSTDKICLVHVRCLSYPPSENLFIRLLLLYVTL